MKHNPQDLITSIEDNLKALKTLYPPKSSFGFNVAKIRKSRGLTQRELGAIMGMTDVAISNIEQRLDLPRANTLKKLTDALKCKVEDLMP